jgi:hypothetical protein
MGGLFDRMQGRIRSPAQGSDTATWLSLEVCCACLLHDLRQLQMHLVPNYTHTPNS